MPYPHITIYTDNLPENVGGCANAFVVRIRNKYRDDAGLHAHEYEHVRQFWLWVALGALGAIALAFMPTMAAYSALWLDALLAGFALHPIAYLMVPRYRLWAEARAYRVQATYYPDDRRKLFAAFIATNYDLSVTVDEAESAIRN